MKNKKFGLITFLIKIMMIIIFGITIYFCLDVFGIIDVPNKYSIASFFYKKIDVLATGVIEEQEVIPNGIIKDVIKVFDTKDENIEDDNNKIDINNLFEKLQNNNNNNNNNNNTSNDVQIENLGDLSNRIYYSQLDQYGKTIYEKMYQNIDNLKTGTYIVDFGSTFDDLLHQDGGKKILTDAFQLSINSLVFDNPDLFYIDITKINLITETTKRAFSVSYKVSIGPNGDNYFADGFENAESVNEAIQRLENVKGNIIIGANKKKNIVDKLKYVHDYLVDNVEYDLYGKNVYNVYGTLVNGKAVCEGYARAYKDILDDMDIACIIACGNGRNNKGETESHAWNYVFVNNSWYAVDTTWDDPIVEKGIGIITSDVRYRNFLKGSKTFFENHFEDGKLVGEFEFKYPTLNEVDY